MRNGISFFLSELKKSCKNTNNIKNMHCFWYFFLWIEKNVVNLADFLSDINF